MFTAKSLKVTLLSWAAKFGMDKGVRRMLGYHAKKGDTTMLAYSRDELAGPLRDLAAMLAAVRSGKFAPDLSRSGRMGAPPAASSSASGSGAGGAASVARSPAAASRESSSAVSSSTSSEVEVQADLGPAPAVGLVLNVRTKVVHLDAGSGAVKCGKAVPLAAEFLRNWSGVEFSRCAKCFGL